MEESHREKSRKKVTGSIVTGKSHGRKSKVVKSHEEDVQEKYTLTVSQHITNTNLYTVIFT